MPPFKVVSLPKVPFSGGDGPKHTAPSTIEVQERSLDKGKTFDQLHAEGFVDQKPDLITTEQGQRGFPVPLQGRQVDNQTEGPIRLPVKLRP
jgi:hypothetical protein